MATTKEQWDQAFSLLSMFERQLIAPKEFKWQYFIDQVGASKATLWRNDKFRDEFERIQALVRQYKNTEIGYSIERSQDSRKDQEIATLKERIKELEAERDRERERLAYAAMIARRHNIDPNEFTDRSPLLKANRLKAEKKTVNMDDPIIQRLKAKKS